MPINAPDEGRQPSPAAGAHPGEKVTSLARALEAYRLCARAEGRSQRTIQWITSGMTYFIRFLGGNQDLGRMTGDDLRRFVLALQGQRPYAYHPHNRPRPTTLSPGSVSCYARAVRAFFGYLKREGFISTNPMERVRLPRVPQKAVPALSQAEAEKLLRQPDRGTSTGFRDFALLLTFIDTGARLSELAGLKLADVDLENGYLRVMGKGSKERYLPLGQKAAKALIKYQTLHRPEPSGVSDWFWLTASGLPFRARRIQRMVRKYGQRAGIGRCHPHKLRHTSSILFLRNGGDPFSLQKKLGHSSLAMTRHYCNLADSDVRRAQLKYSPGDRLQV